VFVAGPRLPAAAEEIATLSARHPEARALTGDDATISDVARALDGAESVHVAAHGRFRDDNPLFTSLELADGNVTVYDLERLRRLPQRIVLSSCESGLSAVRAGDELMGFTAALFALGTRTVIDGRARLHELGAGIEREVASLRFSLRSLATRPSPRMAELLATVARRLDEALLTPAPDRPLVIVPTGELHALPWSLLPSLKDRPHTVAPSTRLWYRAVQAPQAHGTAVFIAGPRLPAATEEIETLGARHPEATTLTGNEATVANAAKALNGADSVHVAAHGSFRDDNPLFTSLELADGKVTVYDLERLPRAPSRIVLSSCESGLSAVSAGDELMGFTAAVFALGTQTVIAAVVPVPDEATKGLMLEVDRRLSEGLDPATALMEARQPDNLPMSAFVCFGSG
jgi:CHAT domain-containing protein